MHDVYLLNCLIYWKNKLTKFIGLKFWTEKKKTILHIYDLFIYL